ncbi:alpha/beta hydrolase [Sphingomonas sp. DT-204]|uniref:alpha/beta hydrolase n=1 Tax=Sphingomonas sp. DT-204 TaxID=3396166 RepID=UPI003F1AF3D5
MIGGILAATALTTATLPAAAQTQRQEQALRAFAEMIPHFERSSFPIEWKDRRYKIFLSIPTGKPPEAGFPVLYVTDANGTFDIAAQTAHNDAMYEEYSRVPPGVIVGIGYDTSIPFPPMRAYDLSPPHSHHPRKGETMPTEAIAGTGGADHLLDMIERKLKPEIARRARIDPERQALFGHSRGGLFVLHTLFTRPEMFRTYIAASPAIWWRDRFILTEQRRFAARAAAGEIKARLLITVGGLEVSTKEERRSRRDPDMVGNARAMSRELGALKAPGFSVRYREFPDDDHMSVIPGTLAAAIRFAFARPR